MDLRLTNKVAIVAGSSRGIGKAIASGLATEGCRVTLCARDASGLEQAASELRRTGAKVLAVAADVAKPEDIARLVEETVLAFGRIDTLINNAGGARTAGPFLETPDGAWQAAVDLNVMAAVRLSRLVVPEMQKVGGGVIINISSVWGREAGGTATYNAVKAAEISLAKSLARELAPINIRVNSVAPGSILFPGGSWDRRMQADPLPARRGHVPAAPSPDLRHSLRVWTPRRCPVKAAAGFPGRNRSADERFFDAQVVGSVGAPPRARNSRASRARRRDSSCWVMAPWKRTE